LRCTSCHTPVHQRLIQSKSNQISGNPRKRICYCGKDLGPKDPSPNKHEKKSPAKRDVVEPPRSRGTRKMLLRFRAEEFRTTLLLLPPSTFFIGLRTLDTHTSVHMCGRVCSLAFPERIWWVSCTRLVELQVMTVIQVHTNGPTVRTILMGACSGCHGVSTHSSHFIVLCVVARSGLVAVSPTNRVVFPRQPVKAEASRFG
jgi:hypothetical protein